MDGEYFLSFLRFFVEEKHLPSLLSLLAPKALLKMESAPYAKSPFGPKSFFRDGELFLSIICFMHLIIFAPMCNHLVWN
jgi:hypothetical protein